MTDYTRSQQKADIRAAFAPRIVHIEFFDIAEEIVVWTEKAVYSFQIGSDDDVMVFTNDFDPTDIVRIEIPAR